MNHNKQDKQYKKGSSQSIRNHEEIGLPIINSTRINQSGNHYGTDIERNFYLTILKDAGQNFQITEKAKAELMQQRLIQFSEIIKIRLRNRLMKIKLSARSLWEQLEKSGGAFFLPDTLGSINWDTDGQGIPYNNKSSSFGGLVNVNYDSMFSTFSGNLTKLTSTAANVMAPVSLRSKVLLSSIGALSLRYVFRQYISFGSPLFILFVSYKGYGE